MSNNQEARALKVACIIPSYNGKCELERLLDSIKIQIQAVSVFVIDSESHDGTYEAAKLALGADHVFQISSKQFNHGGTRQLATELHPDFDIYIFMTQDAYLEDSHAFSKLVEPFSDEKIGAVCGKQLPHHDANELAKHARHFNYPEISRSVDISDAKNMGIKSAFMSNSFAAYRKSALDQVGGFPKHVIFGEDMYVAAKMLLVGWKIGYSSSARCRHSHNYSLLEEFSRYFDMGVFHTRENWIRSNLGAPTGEGVRYAKSEFFSAIHHGFLLAGSSALRSFLKFFAFKIGTKEKFIPKFLKKKLSMYGRFWSSPYA